MKTVGIFLHGQAGDILTASSVLKYRDELWGDHRIVWYIDDNNRDLLKHQDIELRTFPRGYGHPKMVEEQNKLLQGTDKPRWENWQPLCDSNNRMNLSMKHLYPSLADIDVGYFPAPHQMTPVQRHGLDYPTVSKRVFGVPPHYEWHPVISFSDEEHADAKRFLRRVGDSRKVFIETFAGSGQSILDEEMLVHAINIISEAWPDTAFILGSHKFLRGNEAFPSYLYENPCVFSLGQWLTVRQSALVSSKCDLLLSVSSGLTVAASAWDLICPPILQFCGSWVCSTKTLATSECILVTADDKPKQQAKDQYFIKLMYLLNKYS